MELGLEPVDELHTLVGTNTHDLAVAVAGT
jgi:hypothetical protein